MNLGEATRTAETKINNKDEALTEAISMLAAIAHGQSFGNWEYLAMLERMRKFAVPAINFHPFEQSDGVDHEACVHCGKYKAWRGHTAQPTK